MVKVKIQKLHNDVIAPEYQTEHSSGMDLHAYLDNILLTYLNPRDRRLIKCGFKMELPEGYEAVIRPRSGLSIKHGITMINSPGTIDNDYRGEIGVLLLNLGHERFKIEQGMRIAQMIIQPVIQITWVEGVVNDTIRGTGGFGHTGH